MKFLICFVVFASIAIIGIHAGDGDAEMLRSLAQNCKENENASDADVDTMIDKKLPETEQGKCMIACMQEQFGIVDNKKFSKSGMMDLVEMKVKDKDELSKFEQVADACADVQHENRCEMGYLIGKCLAEKSEEYGVNKDL